MKFPKSFLPEKNLDKKIEQLIEGYEEYVDKFEEEQKRLEIVSKLDLDKGVLYMGLDPLRFEQCNLPYEKVVYVGIACAKLGEKFYRYRFNYKSKGKGIRWLEIIDTKLKDDEEFRQIKDRVMEYHHVQFIPNRVGINRYEIMLNKPQRKEDLVKAINNFYCKKFPYLGSKYKLFLTKVVYKCLTKEEFLKSDLPLKRIEVKWKNKRRL